MKGWDWFFSFVIVVILVGLLAGPLMDENHPGLGVAISELESLRRQEKIEQQKEAQRAAEKARVEKDKTCKSVVINYEIEYDTIYTGNQTPLIHRGVYRPQPTCGVPKGMSARLFIPQNISLAVTFDDGRQAHLLTPFFKILNGEPYGFFRYDGNKDWIKMIIDARTEEAGDGSVVNVFVKAAPATEAQWNTDYRRRSRGV